MAKLAVSGDMHRSHIAGDIHSNTAPAHGIEARRVPRLLALLMFSSLSILSFTGSSGRKFQAATVLDKAILAFRKPRVTAAPCAAVRLKHGNPCA